MQMGTIQPGAIQLGAMQPGVMQLDAIQPVITINRSSPSTGHHHQPGITNRAPTIFRPRKLLNGDRAFEHRVLGWNEFASYFGKKFFEKVLSFFNG